MKFGCCASAKLYREVALAGYDFIELPGWEIENIPMKNLKR